MFPIGDENPSRTTPVVTWALIAANLAVSAEIGKDAAAVAKGYFAYIFMVTPSVALKLAEKHPWI